MIYFISSCNERISLQDPHDVLQMCQYQFFIKSLNKLYIYKSKRSIQKAKEAQKVINLADTSTMTSQYCDNIFPLPFFHA